VKPLSPLEAYHEIMAFASERGEHALTLALHAAVPQTFRPSFLHLLRLNFVPEALAEPWTEADVLFAPFCEHLGGDYYRFDGQTRRLLIENLAGNFPSEKPARLQRVANLLAAWLDTLERSPSHAGDPVARDYVSVERWLALAYLNPDAAAAQLAHGLEASLEGERAAARLRLGGLMSSLASPLAGHANLLTYAAGLVAFGEGRLSDAREIFDTLPDAPINVAGATLRSPRALVGSIPTQPAEPIRLLGVRSVAIVVSQGEPRGITLNIDCDFLNPNRVFATIQRLVVRLDLEDPHGQSLQLHWNLVYQGQTLPDRTLQQKTAEPGSLTLPPGEQLDVGVQVRAGRDAQGYEWSTGNYTLHLQAWTQGSDATPDVDAAYEVDVTETNVAELRRWTKASANEWAALGDPNNAVAIPVAIQPRRPRLGLVVLVRREEPLPMGEWFREELEKSGYDVEERTPDRALVGTQPRFLVIDLRESLSRAESISLLANPQMPVIVPMGPADAPWHIHLNEMNIVQGIDDVERYLAHPPADVETARLRLLARLEALPVEESESATHFAPQIFLCYATEDERQVTQVHRRLKKMGFKPWLDKNDLLPGQEWRTEIPKVIKTSDFMLMFLSQISVGKRGYEQRQFKLALEVLHETREGGVPAILTLLDHCQVPEAFRDLQWVNLFEEDGFEKLVKSIQTQVRPRVHLDPETKLMWTIEDNGRDINWHEANEYAKKLRLGGYSDWRLPTIKELEKLYDPKESERKNIRKPFRLTNWWVWSSTMEGSDSAWGFSFYSGERNRARLGASGVPRALCVRRSGE
jgi:hypothetical protein